jgi:hypothetical protein
MSNYPYKYIYVHSTSMSISEKPSQFDLKIHEVDHQEHLIRSCYGSRPIYFFEMV